MAEETIYKLTLEGDNTVRTIFDRFYIINKSDPHLTDDDRKIIEKYMCELVNEDVRAGKDGFLIFRGTKKKRFTEEQCKEIREDKNLTQRQLAEKYKCSIGTINKIINQKY